MKDTELPKLLSPSEAFKMMVNAINWFHKKNYRVEDLYIYCPNWYRQYLVAESSGLMYIDKENPDKFFGVDFVDGYENAIIITNSRKRNKSYFYPVTQQRIELI